MKNLIYSVKEMKWYIFWYIIFVSFTQLTELQPFTKFVLWVIPFFIIFGIISVMMEQRRIYKKYLNDKD